MRSRCAPTWRGTPRCCTGRWRRHRLLRTGPLCAPAWPGRTSCWPRTCMRTGRRTSATLTSPSPARPGSRWPAAAGPGPTGPGCCPTIPATPRPGRRSCSPPRREGRRSWTRPTPSVASCTPGRPRPSHPRSCTSWSPVYATPRAHRPRTAAPSVMGPSCAGFVTGSSWRPGVGTAGWSTAPPGSARRTCSAWRSKSSRNAVAWSSAPRAWPTTQADRSPLWHRLCGSSTPGPIPWSTSWSGVGPGTRKGGQPSASPTTWHPSSTRMPNLWSWSSTTSTGRTRPSRPSCHGCAPSRAVGGGAC